MTDRSSSPYDRQLDYYERRAEEYDSTSWEAADLDSDVVARVRGVLASMSPVATADVGCGTGYVSRWLPGQLTLVDASSAMLGLARRRVPTARIVRSSVPPLPFAAGTFGRIFCANLYGNLGLRDRRELVLEAVRVADELVVLEQLAEDGVFREGEESRSLNDGSEFVIHKCYFTVERLLDEIGGGEVLMSGPVVAIVRRRR